MGEQEYMKQQIEEKLQQGFNCIKLKIGDIDFQKELDLLDFIRQHFSSEEIEIRVDANGAFTKDNALDKLFQLSKYELHSIEQPIKQGQIKVMADLCRTTPLPIALDEELIGVFGYENKDILLKEIMPQYIILKPSLIGGYRGCKEWIDIAEKLGINWWITSALESNIGLNAIAQWTFLQNNPMPQGLGTGALYTNNFESPLEVKQGHLNYNTNLDWIVNI
jgi:L-alanine-DL-glutamate epimerase-like enolase superfamily enzyme